MKAVVMSYFNAIQFIIRLIFILGAITTLPGTNLSSNPGDVFALPTSSMPGAQLAKTATAVPSSIFEPQDHENLPTRPFKVEQVTRPLTKSVADEVSELLGRIGRPEAALVASMLKGSVSETDNLGDNLDDLSRNHNPEVLMDSASSTSIAHEDNITATVSGSATTNTGAGGVLSELTPKKIDPSTKQEVSENIKYFKEPELAAEGAVENALLQMQQRQLAQSEAQIEIDEKALRAKQDELRGTRKEVSELERKIQSLHRQMEWQERAIKRQEESLKRKTDAAFKLRSRIEELSDIVVDRRREASLEDARQAGRRSALTRLTGILQQLDSAPTDSGDETMNVDNNEALDTSRVPDAQDRKESVDGHREVSMATHSEL